jgi:hypothetical protein
VNRQHADNQQKPDVVANRVEKETTGILPQQRRNDAVEDKRLEDEKEEHEPFDALQRYLLLSQRPDNCKATASKRDMVDGVDDFVQPGLFGSDVDNVLRIQDRQHTEHSCNAVDAPTLLLEGAAFLFDLLHRSWLGRNWSVHC